MERIVLGPTHPLLLGAEKLVLKHDKATKQNEIFTSRFLALFIYQPTNHPQPHFLQSKSSLLTIWLGYYHIQ